MSRMRTTEKDDEVMATGAQGSSGEASEKRHSRTKRRSLSFRGRVALSFALMTLFTSILFVVVLSFVWSGQFGAYTRENMEEIATSTASSLAHEYDLRSYWDVSELQGLLSVTDMFDGVGVQVLNSGGVPIYDNTWLLDSNISLAPDSSSMVSEPIISESGTQVGTVNVWAMGSDTLLTAKDMSFRRVSLQGIVGAAVAALVISVVAGFVFSRTLTKPIRSISSTAQRIKEGDLTARTGVRGPDDIGQLGETFDEMAESIEKDRELEKRLTADVAHELRTPLMSILATVEAMEDEVMPCDQEHLALVDGETKRLSRLVDSMLRLSRLENGSVRMHFGPIDAVDFIRGIASSHLALLAESGLELTFENRTGQGAFTVELDRDTITQAVTNLLSNAMRYTPAPGKVTIWIDGDTDEVRIGVSDTGIGISKENLSRVFGRFWRAEESRNRAKGGLGVGLAVTKEIVDNHHGHVEVASEVGVGTTFTIVIPREQPKHEGK